jgi:hypothetical protein
MQRQTSTNHRDAPGQDTGRSQGHLSSYLLGGAPGERHRARCKTDSRGCDTLRRTRRMPKAEPEEYRPGNPQGDSRQPRTDRECDNDKEPARRNETRRKGTAEHTPPCAWRRQKEASRRADPGRRGRSSTVRARGEEKTAGGQQNNGKHTPGHPLTHRSTRRETGAHKIRARAHKIRPSPGREPRGRQRQ